MAVNGGDAGADIVCQLKALSQCLNTLTKLTAEARFFKSIIQVQCLLLNISLQAPIGLALQQLGTLEQLVLFTVQENAKGFELQPVDLK